MNMKNTYKELIKMGKDAIEAAQVPFKVKAEQKKLELKMLEEESKIASLELEVQKLKGANPINWDSLLNAIDKVELAKRVFKKLELLNEELFAETK